MFAVDKAILAVRPHPPTNLSLALASAVATDRYGTASSYAQLASVHGIAAAQAALQAMLAADPWLPAAWPLQPTGHSLAERSLDSVLASHSSDLTAMPYRRAPHPAFPMSHEQLLSVTSRY